MCAICKDWNMGLITTKEAWRNLQEFITVGRENEEDLQHFFELAEKLHESEQDPNQNQ